MQLCHNLKGKTNNQAGNYGIVIKIRRETVGEETLNQVIGRGGRFQIRFSGGNDNLN